jgi:hypothetical protein
MALMWACACGLQALLTAACSWVCCRWLQVLWAVARVLQLQHNQVHVTCRRVGGGFGGKVGAWLEEGAGMQCGVHQPMLAELGMMRRASTLLSARCMRGPCRCVSCATCQSMPACR